MEMQSEVLCRGGGGEGGMQVSYQVHCYSVAHQPFALSIVINGIVLSAMKSTEVLNPRHHHLGLRLAAVVTQSVHRPVCKRK